MDLKELKKEVEHFAKIERKRFKSLDKTEEAGMVLFVITIDKNKKKQVGIVLVIIPDGMNKHFAFYTLGKIFSEKVKKKVQFERIDAVIVITEAWYSVVKKGSKDFDRIEKGGNLSVMPSKDPKRKEALMITGMNENRESVSIMFDIIEKDGKRTLRKKKQPDSTKAFILDKFWDGFLPQMKMY